MHFLFIHFFLSLDQKAERKEIPVDINKTQSAIKQILKAYESKKQWKEILKLANKEFDSLTKKLQLNTHEMVCTVCLGNFMKYIIA